MPKDPGMSRSRATPVPPTFTKKKSRPPPRKSSLREETRATPDDISGISPHDRSGIDSEGDPRSASHRYRRGSDSKGYLSSASTRDRSGIDSEGDPRSASTRDRSASQTSSGGGVPESTTLDTKVGVRDTGPRDWRRVLRKSREHPGLTDCGDPESLRDPIQEKYGTPPLPTIKPRLKTMPSRRIWRRHIMVNLKKVWPVLSEIKRPRRKKDCPRMHG